MALQVQPLVSAAPGARASGAAGAVAARHAARQQLPLAQNGASGVLPPELGRVRGAHLQVRRNAGFKAQPSCYILACD